MPRTLKTTKSASGEYVAYYRVSDVKQGISGLGLEAQRAAVERYLAGVKGTLIAGYTEVESGKRHLNRPELLAAIAASKKHGATLVIAKLDRLARNVHFISGLMESAADFVAVDMPAANKLTLHIMASMAEHEREQISGRTRAALEQVKARGVKLGNPRWRESIAKARAARLPPPALGEIVRMIGERREAGESLRQIAAAFNRLGLKTASGSAWHPSSVRAALLAA